MKFTHKQVKHVAFMNEEAYLLKYPCIFIVKLTEIHFLRIKKLTYLYCMDKEIHTTNILKMNKDIATVRN